MFRLSPSNPHSSGRIGELESIRGLAALGIVLYHLPDWNAVYSSPGADRLYILVDLFFVLSGFVIEWTYGGSLRSGSGLLRFLLLRIGRLYPVHLLFLLIFLLFETAKYIAVETLGLPSPNSPPFQINNGTAFFQHLLLIQAIGPTDNATTFNFPSWSISVELAAYLIFGLFSLTAARIRKALSILVAGASLLSLLTVTTVGFDPLLRCLAGFFFGCLSAQAVIGLRLKQIPAFVPVITLSAVILFILLRPDKILDPLIYPLTAVMIATLVLSQDSILRQALRHPVLLGLGTLSYALYMSHAAVIWAINQIIRLVLHPPEAVYGGISSPQLSVNGALLGGLLVLCVTLALSAVTYRWIENPLRQASRRLAGRLFPS